MTLAIMQPTFLPWIGYFDMIDHVDKFIFLDDVQVVRRSWGVRNRIKSNKGELLLTIPVKKTQSRENTLYDNAIISPELDWRNKHLTSISHNYSKAPYFHSIYELITKWYDSDVTNLSDFNILIIQSIMKYLSIQTETLRSSSLGKINGRKDQKLLNICEYIGADKYLAALGSSSYIEINNESGAFQNSKTQLLYNNYSHPVYNQLYGSFIPYLSVIDLLFNHSAKESLDIIKSGRDNPIPPSQIREDFYAN